MTALQLQMSRCHLDSWPLSLTDRRVSLSRHYVKARVTMVSDALTPLIDQQISYGYRPDVGASYEQGVVSFRNKILKRHPAGGIFSETLLEPAALRPSGLAVIRVDGVVQYDLQVSRR